MNRVVITGMGVVSPVGLNIPDYWAALLNGVCGIAPIASFDASGMKVRLAAELKGFDPTAFGMEKNVARKLDPFVQYAMAAAREAMAQSGLEAGKNMDAERLGVYIGSGIGGMQTFVAETRKSIERGPEKVSPHFIPMMIANMASGHVAIAYNAQGPCLPVVTACATSTSAIGEAFHAIQAGYADAILAGGSEAAICPLAIGGFTNCMALSAAEDPLLASLPFDKRRSGFVMGEGAGVLVLENYEHAKARGAVALAEICGYGNTCDAYHVTAPNPEATAGARAIRLAMQEAGYTDRDRVYINAHGTGTALNDVSETLAIKRALGEDAARRALISSTKSMTGHMLGAAGAAECIASVLALKDGVIPPTIGLTEPDPECDLDYVPLTRRQAQCDLALSISLGFGGHNGCIALRRAEQ
ncbi:MAG TPA: beta-ketoacyl-ACP synthase II [Candidatus Limiplasma sp.]|nr:beta-ketoacyl-ACP synthase II [Candidatus Limiplasma sp.]